MGIAPGQHETGESEREGGGEREAGGLTGLWLHQPSGCHVRTRPWASCGKRRRPQREGLVRAQAHSQCKASPLGPGHTSSSRFQPCEWHHHEHPPPTLETWVPSLPRPCGFCHVHEAALALHQLWTALLRGHTQGPAWSPPVRSPSGPAHSPPSHLLTVAPVILPAQETRAAHLSSVVSTVWLRSQAPWLA